MQKLDFEVRKKLLQLEGAFFNRGGFGGGVVVDGFADPVGLVSGVDSLENFRV